MSKHITGPLSVGEAVVDTEDGIQEIIINAMVDGREYFPFVAIEFKHAPGMQQANARRVVACWNACAGIGTEVLENILLMGDTLNSRFELRANEEKALIVQRDELLEALRGMLKAYDDGVTDWEKPYQQAARTAIANTTKQSP